jgi:hypothetical protein
LLQISETRRFICIKGNGHFTAEEVADHFHKLELMILERRASCEDVRVLIDLRGAATQTNAIAMSIAEATNRIYSGSTDRVAIVVASALLKLQLKRIHAGQAFGIFVSEPAARKFLGLVDD